MSELRIKKLVHKHQVKCDLADKWERKAASVPGKSRRGSRTGPRSNGSLRKRRLITRATKYRQQANLLMCEIEKNNENPT